jgi:hypothetical protein
MMNPKILEMVISKGAGQQFADIAMKEEETTQRLIDVKKKKLDGAQQEALAKINAKTQIRLQHDQLKAELAIKKQEQMFWLQMMEMGHRSAQSTSNSFQMPSSNYTPSSMSHHNALASFFFFFFCQHFITRPYIIHVSRTYGRANK